MSSHREEKGGRRWPAMLMVFGLLCCLALATAGLVLKKGVEGAGFTLGPVGISSFRLQWREKVVLHIDELTLDLQREDDSPGAGMQSLDRVLPFIRTVERLFQEITIHRVQAGKLSGSLRYAEDTLFSDLSAKDFSLRSRLQREGDSFRLDIEELVSDTYNSRGTGQLLLHPGDLRASGSMELLLAGSLPLALDLTCDREGISFKGREAGVITTITPFVDLFALDPDIQCWITDYLTGSRYELKEIRGNFSWDRPQEILDTLYGEVRVEDCQYTFAPGLEPIKTSHTDVVFRKGVLSITPHDSTFYGQDGERSWLDIDFNDPDNIILTAYILTSAVANEDILRLLNYYDVSLPFLQVEGKTETDLTLEINLNREELTASGVFLVGEGAFEYEGKAYGIRDSRILLEDATLEVEQLHISLGDLFAADVTGRVDLAQGMGDLDIEVAEFAIKMGGARLTLDPAEEPPSLTYRIRPDGESVEATASAWQYDELSLHLDDFSIDFDFSEFSGVLPPTTLSVKDNLTTTIGGPFSVKEQRVDFQGDLLACNVGGAVLKEKHLPFGLQYDHGLTVRIHKESQWGLNKVPVTLSPATFTYKEKSLSIVSAQVSSGENFHSGVSGTYNFTDTSEGSFLLEELLLSSEKHGELLSPESAVSLAMEKRDGRFLVRAPDLGVEIIGGKEQGWALRLHGLDLLHEHSALLQRYLLDNGSLMLSIADGGEKYVFRAETHLAHPVLVRDNSPMDELVVNGEFSGETMQATVNTDIELVYDKTLKITSKGISYNIPAILDYLDESPPPSNDEKDESMTISLVAYDSSLFFAPDSQAPADRLKLNSEDGAIQLKLEHGEGTVGVDIEGEHFSLLGDKLNDHFMTSLSMDARLEGGEMSMAAFGRFDEFSALVRVDNTVLKDYKTLNNILAFVNTIPALITFSLPEYNAKGLPVSSAVAGMKVREGRVYFESMDIESPELGIEGSGWLDLPKKEIDMDLNLITQSKVNVGKIPLIGYILAGEEKHPSVTLKVTGDLMNPKVESEMFREVVTVPFSIIYRTLALPAHMVTPIIEGVGEDQAWEEVPDNEPKDEWPEEAK